MVVRHIVADDEELGMEVSSGTISLVL